MLKNRLSEYSLFFLTLSVYNARIGRNQKYFCKSFPKRSSSPSILFSFAFYQSSAIIFLKISTHSVLPGHAAVVCTLWIPAPSKSKCHQPLCFAGKGMENKTRLRLERIIFHASLSLLMALTFARLGISECRPQLHAPDRMEWVEIPLTRISKY